MVDHQQLQYLLPTHGLAAVWQAPRPPQRESAQPHLQAIDGIFGNLALFGEKAEGARTIPLLVEDLQGLAQAACFSDCRQKS
jgi:hypothetical protein